MVPPPRASRLPQDVLAHLGTWTACFAGQPLRWSYRCGEARVLAAGHMGFSLQLSGPQLNFQSPFKFSKLFHFLRESEEVQAAHPSATASLGQRLHGCHFRIPSPESVSNSLCAWTKLLNLLALA